ncbi:MAG: hypothetical protein HC929_04435 [Leptolyngbyaceae cyanobacterium SM2_5_2]|nr:hypothetical protein [Leptolyngbyaceae cyanobacterium SM2_5_2]
MVILAGSGCKLQVLPQTPTATTLTITTTREEAGEFVVKGTTNLPDDTRLTAVALRYLELNRPIGDQGRVVYSILAYQPATVENGQWTARLNLWQVAADGRYQESWQPQLEALNLSATPDSSVQFAVTLAPPELFTARHLSLSQNSPQTLAGLRRQTPDGDLFLWNSILSTVTLPTGQTTPPTDLASDQNGGWGERYRLVPEPPLPYTLTPEDERKTNAPPHPAEFLQ